MSEKTESAWSEAERAAVLALKPTLAWTAGNASVTAGTSWLKFNDGLDWTFRLQGEIELRWLAGLLGRSLKSCYPLPGFVVSDSRLLDGPCGLARITKVRMDSALLDLTIGRNSCRLFVADTADLLYYLQQLFNVPVSCQLPTAGKDCSITAAGQKIVVVFGGDQPEHYILNRKTANCLMHGLLWLAGEPSGDSFINIDWDKRVIRVFLREQYEWCFVRFGVRGNQYALGRSELVQLAAQLSIALLAGGGKKRGGK